MRLADEYGKSCTRRPLPPVLNNITLRKDDTMKRFYCTICEKIIRVRRVPDNVESYDLETPERRVGRCRWHEHDSSRGEVRRQDNLSSYIPPGTGARKPRPQPSRSESTTKKTAKVA